MHIAALQACRLTMKTAVLVACLLLTAPAAQAASAPACPTDSAAPYPLPGAIGDPPTVVSWQGLTELPDSCRIGLQEPATLTIALSGQFRHDGTTEEIAERLGAISNTKNLPYWSVTDGDWRVLVSDAFALDSSDSRSMRSDFTAREMSSGQTLYFAQNDTRSWGLNVYSVKAVHSSSEHLIIDSENLSAIRLGPVTLFNPGDVQSVLFIDRHDATTWTYFSLSVIRRSTLAAREKSLINRQSAFYRLLIGQAPDQEPPLAP